MQALVKTRQLLEPVLDSGIANTNFFNGRILTAGDLQTDQDANRAQHEQLGLGIGAGIVQGLWASVAASGSGGTQPVVAVSQGLALNRLGQAVALPLDVQVALTRQTTPLAVNAGLFADCAPPTTSAVPLQAGFYILTAAPTSGFAGSAPMFGFNDVTAATGCGSGNAVEGVLFRLVPLDVAKLSRLSQATRSGIAKLMAATDAASLSRLRNWIAHICFGTEEVAGFLADPFARSNGESPYISYGAVDSLIGSGVLSTADVPLALLYWTVAGVQFLDCWSVRRRPEPAPVGTSWPLPFSARRHGEAEAVFRQYESQLAAIFDSSMTDPQIAALSAKAYFRYLPVCAPIPTDGGGRRGFDIHSFLSGITYRPQVFIEGSRLGALYASSLDYAPIDLASGELVWAYLVRENIEAIDDAAGTPQQYLVLATGQMPFAGEARFNVNRWDYANFS
jgi:hypothetical protein